MPAPIIPGVFKVTLEWARVDGVMPRNVLHVYAPGATQQHVLSTVDSAMQAHQFGCMLNTFTFHSYSVIPLDGATAEITGTGSGAGGDQTGDMIPAAACVVSLKTAVRGSKGRGRVFIGPVGEAAQSMGIMDATLRGQMQTAWDAFRAALLAAPPPVADLVVVSYKHGTYAPVVSSFVELTLGTQRRRQSQLR